MVTLRHLVVEVLPSGRNLSKLTVNYRIVVGGMTKSRMLKTEPPCLISQFDNGLSRINALQTILTLEQA